MSASIVSPCARLLLALAASVALHPATAQTPTAASAQASAYQYRAPAGWVAALDADTETLTPQAEPPGTVQLLLLPPKPVQTALPAQFAQERSALEAHWGLRAPQAAPPQSGQAGAITWAAHFASYDSEGGPRYLGFMGLGNGQRFAMLVFVASSHEAFNRLVPQALDVYRSLAFR